MSLSKKAEQAQNGKLSTLFLLYTDKFGEHKANPLIFFILSKISHKYDRD